MNLYDTSPSQSSEWLEGVTQIHIPGILTTAAKVLLCALLYLSFKCSKKHK